MQNPSMCAFGVADGQTVLVTSRCRSDKDLEAALHAGRLLRAQGLVEPRLLA